MRSLVRLRAVVTLVTVAVVAAACGSDSSGPRVNFPTIGGSYTGTITYQMSGDPQLTAPLVPGIAISMGDPDGNGNFSGSFAFNSGFTGNGTVVGQFSSDGSSINWLQFGDANEPLFFVSSFLAINYPNCNFQGALFSLDANGGFDGSGNLNLDGQYTGIRCAIDNAGDSDVTQMAVALASFNPQPIQGVAKPLGLHSALRGGVQRVR
ncbi:MAG TPA: hypothetical protein VNW46_13035 [Gemmatimonadaceae bacterium]|jgi:hypothetical protein|nr:hypothetical protein [Gemmatimonadaceae bacterium]